MEHSRKPHAGMLLQLAGKQPTGRFEGHLEAGRGASGSHRDGVHRIPLKFTGIQYN